MWGRRLALTSGSGSSPRGRLDGGTAVLFRETEPPAAAGSWTWLRVRRDRPRHRRLARRDAVVTGVDVNQRAVLLATENAASLGVRTGTRP